MKLKSLIAIAVLTLCTQGVMAQPKSRIQAQTEADKKAETSLSDPSDIFLRPSTLHLAFSETT